MIHDESYDSYCFGGSAIQIAEKIDFNSKSSNFMSKLKNYTIRNPKS